MLRSTKDIFGYPIEALDGSIGKVKDCLFDDRHWRLRYVVVDTGKWLPGRKVIISPLHAKQPGLGWHGRDFPISLTKKEIEESPRLEEDEPVSAQYEEEYAKHFTQIHPYWAGPYAWGLGPTPTYPSADAMGSQMPPEVEKQHRTELKKIEHSHLRSAHEIINYTIDARDDSFGHVEDFILDDEDWRLAYLVVATRNWLPGKKFLVDIDWIETFDWASKSAQISLSRSQIESAPQYDPKTPINRDYENEIYDYYGRPAPWSQTDAYIH
ncbi:PRC-barrel domain-containing protein [Pelagicoccus sp. SDUM812003]|uniref:PRC-barrel domain-containing protein n=1 Tax=Pelagicoccus sp. SDUM812003 TaxID=3041267 RepID=UPI00280E6C2A|nr:PRC-barrel domain-containing protein [Pelagicoccus sp. SDUM812003]MDQ8205044.1 PRC-barrel domain-containing protein [Pelagicoccus sp. SDUM812003]